MADAVYPKFKYELLNQTFTLDLNTNLFVALVETDATGGDVAVNAAYDGADKYLSDVFTGITTTEYLGQQSAANLLANGVIAIVQLTGANTTTVSANAIFDAANVTFSAVPAFDDGGGASSGDGNALIIYANNTTVQNSQLIAWLDTSVTGLAVTPNATDINLNWSDSGIFEL